MIYGIYQLPVDKKQINGQDLVAAGYCLFSSSTCFVSTRRNKPVTMSVLVDDTWQQTHTHIQIPAKCKIYSINEAYTKLWSREMQKFIERLKDMNFSSRYIGSMVADIHRTLLKGGVFIYPKTRISPHGKLRYLYEVAPMALIIENAGGQALFTIPNDISIDKPHERCECILGDKDIIAILTELTIS